MGRQRRHHEARIVGEQADVPDTRALDMSETFGDAVEIGLAADQADTRMLLGLPDEVLARAKADLKPDAVGRQAAAKGLGEIDLLGRIRRQCQQKTGQQRVEQRLLPGPQFLAPTTTMQRASTGVVHEAEPTSPRRSGTDPFATWRRRAA